MAKTKSINIRLDDVTDVEIIDFLEEKQANTFIIKEALKLYMDAYKKLGQGIQLGEQQLPSKLSKFKNMG
jgi:hypothetical protein